MIQELYNAKIFYQLNWTILWDSESKKLYWRNTWTGKEIKLGIAENKNEAKKLMIEKAGRIRNIKNKIVK